MCAAGVQVSILTSAAGSAQPGDKPRHAAGAATGHAAAGAARYAIDAADAVAEARAWPGSNGGAAAQRSQVGGTLWRGYTAYRRHTLATARN